MTIPFEKIGINDFAVSNKPSNKVSSKLNNSQLKIISAMRDNPNVTINQLMVIANLSEPSIKKNIKKIKEKDCILRMRGNKNGYWEVLK